MQLYNLDCDSFLDILDRVHRPFQTITIIPCDGSEPDVGQGPERPHDVIGPNVNVCGHKQQKPICKPNRSKQIRTLNDRLGILPPVRNVITAGDRTIVFFDDGTKTSVQCRKGDTYSAEAGIAFALLKRVLGKQVEGNPEVRGNGYDRILADIAGLAKEQEKKRTEASRKEKAEKAAKKAAAANANDQQ